MATKELTAGTIHDKVPLDLQTMLRPSPEAVAAWESLTPLARNEWLCWVDNAKLIETRNRRIERTRDELIEGIRRPCCWFGCIHRTDKALSPSQKMVLNKK